MEGGTIKMFTQKYICRALVLEMQNESGKDIKHTIIFFEQRLKKYWCCVVVINFIKVAPSSSNEEISCVLELNISEVDIYKLSLLVDDMTWRVYDFLLCKVCKSISGQDAKIDFPTDLTQSART